MSWISHSLLNCSPMLLCVSWSQENGSDVFHGLWGDDYAKLVPEQMPL